MGDTLQWTYPDARNTNGTQVSVQSAPHPPCGQSLIPGKETGTQAVRPAGTFSRSEKAMPLTRPAGTLSRSEKAVPLIPGKETGTQAVRPAGTFSRSEKAMPLTPASFLCSSEDRHLCRVG
jgi:hypothetical protein